MSPHPTAPRPAAEPARGAPARGAPGMRAAGAAGGGAAPAPPGPGPRRRPGGHPRGPLRGPPRVRAVNGLRPAGAPVPAPAVAPGARAQRRAGALPALRINEFLAGPARDWDGSGTFSSRDDEWVEVMNPGATVTALDGYFLTDGDSIPRYAF